MSMDVESSVRNMGSVAHGAVGGVVLALAETDHQGKINSGFLYNGMQGHNSVHFSPFRGVHPTGNTVNPLCLCHSPIEYSTCVWVDDICKVYTI